MLLRYVSLMSSKIRLTRLSSHLSVTLAYARVCVASVCLSEWTSTCVRKLPNVITWHHDSVTPVRLHHRVIAPRDIKPSCLAHHVTTAIITRWYLSTEMTVSARFVGHIRHLEHKLQALKSQTFVQRTMYDGNHRTDVRSTCTKLTHKQLCCRKETARCFVSLNILLSHSTSLKVIRNDTAE